MTYKFIEGLTVADVAFTAQGNGLRQLFVSCGKAVTATMVKKASSIRPTTKTPLNLSAKNSEQLLHDFLEELVYLKDAKLMLYSKFNLKITVDKTKHTATGFMFGEKIRPKRHQLLVDVKAVTWHAFKLNATKDGQFVATVVLDV